METTGVSVLERPGEVAAGESPAGGTATGGGAGGNALAGAAPAGAVGAVGGEAVGGGAVGAEVVVVGAPDGLGRVTVLVDALLVELRALSLEGADRGLLRGLVAALGRVRAGADAAEAKAVTALEALGDGGVDAVEVIRRNVGASQREARRRQRRAQALAGMPNVADALAGGDISTEHAEALARAASATSPQAVDGDAELLAQVAGVPADRAGRAIEAWTQRNQDPADLHERHLRQRRRRRLQFGDGDDGMLMAHAAFDRVLGAQFRSLINGIADRIWRDEGGRDNPDGRSPEQRRLDALAIAVGLEPEPVAAEAETGAAGQPAAEVARAVLNGSARNGSAAGGASGDDCGPVTVGGPTASGRNGGRGGLPVSPRHQVVIVASADVVSGADPQGRCEIPGVGPIPQSELERLACDAELFGLLFSGDGEPLWHGRGERTATDAQRRALLARDGVCVLCAEEPSRCEAHHIVPWAKPGEGPTDIDNLALLCGTCHRRLHNNKRILTRTPDGTWGTASDPRHTGRAKRNAPIRSAVDAAAPRQAVRNARPPRPVACVVHTGEITWTLDLTDGLVPAGRLMPMGGPVPTGRLVPTGGLNAAGAPQGTSRPETASPIRGCAGDPDRHFEAPASDPLQPTSSGRDPPRQTTAGSSAGNL